jgi:hypothetical protein
MGGPTPLVAPSGGTPRRPCPSCRSGKDGGDHAGEIFSAPGNPRPHSGVLARTSHREVRRVARSETLRRTGRVRAHRACHAALRGSQLRRRLSSEDRHRHQQTSAADCARASESIRCRRGRDRRLATKSTDPNGLSLGLKAHNAIVQSAAALWPIAYLPSLFIGMIGNENLAQSATRSAWLMVPIAGPFVLLGHATGSTAKALLIADGAFQAVGASLMTLGLLWRVPILVREEKAVLAVRPSLVLRGGDVELGMEGRF